MTDDKKKPEDETPKAQAEDAKPSEDLSDEELSKAAGGVIPMSPNDPGQQQVVQNFHNLQSPAVHEIGSSPSLTQGLEPIQQ